MSRAEITLAKTAGFCFGVNRAVEMVYHLLDEGKKVCTLGPIIHNPQLVEELAGRGVRIVERPEEAAGDETVVIRSHGVEQAVYDQAAAMGLAVADATCPYVAKIHRIVREASAAGRTVLIAGDASHQEVLGIRGHCQGPSYVFQTPEELEKLAAERPELAHAPVTAVAQTTFHAEIWNACQKTLKKVYTNAIIFDTICNATAARQEEAAQLARSSDLMLVIGGRHSSNTAKLRDVCAALCPRTFLIETAAEIPEEEIRRAVSIGVAAGASTPAGIIKEVLKTMSEILNTVEGSDAAVTPAETTSEPAATPAESVTEAAAPAETTGEQAAAPAEPVTEKSFEEMTFEEALEASLNSLNTDQKVRGVVLSVSPTEIQVDIGRKQTGYVSQNEYSSDPSVKLQDEVKVGDVLNLIVMRTNDQEGTVMLSKKRFDAIAGWDKVVAAKDSEEILEGTVTEIIKGGLIAVTENVRVFIPASQATLSRGEPLDELKGQKVRFRIIEIGRGRRAIGSIRSVLREERKALEEKFWQQVEVGQHYTGVVKSLTSYGAFVDLGGVDGMIHISELSWTRIKHPSEIVNVGDTVEVYIKDIDNEKKKISLGFKKAEDNPWEILKRDYPVGSVVKATVVSMTPYGAFARVIPGIDGLIHISQIADRRIDKPQDELSIGQEVDVKIIAIDFERKRVSLSIRALLEESPAEEVAEAPVAEEVPAAEPVAEEAPAEEAAPAEETPAE
ncbi:MAG TPA: bifunctional 4-hydroxy-3-methylbut-2-enyl diphosphate reductase/30S ribosomal protein S1 [Firmicutes bacterium]|nr:bifunctional 4-hydroxy-3-methylbut-2-enyl diphosphate reductase/30S ribosomal protein S1 [Bacillota bacterium]